VKKVNFTLEQPKIGPEGQKRYSSTLSLTTALDGDAVTATFRALYPRKRDPVSIYERLGGTQDRSGRMRKISSPLGFDPQTGQPVASSYTV
jgi:hypothetical protein